MGFQPIVKISKELVKNPFLLLVICIFAFSYLFHSSSVVLEKDEGNLYLGASRHIRSSELAVKLQPQESSHNGTHGREDSEEEEPERFHVATVNWSRVANPYIISLWIVVAGLVKIGFHLIYKVVSRVPESCVLICVGLVVGGVAYSINKHHRIEQLLFNPDAFFLFILPPIVMEAGYFMPKEAFFENIGTILTYAIVGTIFNTLAIGLSLYGVYCADLMPGIENLNLLHCLLFGSIISAVDPVAVISVFEEIHVNTILYICVFGESLLNDGVAVVLFKMFENYIEIGQENILPMDIVLGLLSFFVVAIGALIIGITFGYLGAFVTKYTVHNRIIEPTFVFVFCYMSYLTAEVFHLSGIIAIVFAGFTMNSYVEQNISTKSHTTVKYGMKMLANVAETIIFMLLGIAAVSDFWQYWNTGLVLWTLLFITLFRFIGVYSLTAIANRIRLDKIDKVDQFVMAYGGLRGGIAFSLVSLTPAEHVPAIKSMVCACIVAILFTSFIQGSTIRPIVELLKVKTATNHELTMLEDINARLIDHMLAGIEDITGYHGHHHWMQWLHEINVKYLAKWFIREPYKTRHEEIFETFHRINKRDAEELVEDFERGGSTSSSDMKPTPTLTNLLIPIEMRKSYSQASFNRFAREHSTQDACIDMNAIHMKQKESTKSSQAADVHHLLEQNMYKPRRRERTRHPRGNIDDDDDRKKEEQEIMMRHKIAMQYQRRHFKHKHSRHKRRNSSKPSLPISSSKKNLKPNSSVVSTKNEKMSLLSVPTFKVDHARDHVEKTNSDEGIVFTAAPVIEERTKKNWKFGNGKMAKNPLGFMSSFEALPEETAEHPTETTDIGDFDTAVALDRELPWKQKADKAVYDPHNNDSRGSLRSSEARLQELGHSDGIELWPRKGKNTNIQTNGTPSQGDKSHVVSIDVLPTNSQAFSEDKV